MSTSKTKPAPKRTERRKYEKPAFLPSLAFERQALSCAGCLNAAASPPFFCALNS